ncbi:MULTISPECIES: DUF493 family protein YbeD [Volucribacter]|uniref:UPF0250 protein EV694_0703 n=2 Tax=Volucribacter TaxID=256730 RepID=A0A4R1FSY4_9PAST|nr:MULTISPECIES: DUF493 family protein YbeD [Volucribacter]MDG6895764.1 hypothetical protein [Volucribacter amazonae]TCJ98316.1 hypothetical protein EV694_0703 [Volucribacter psittacicida]
MSKEVNLSELPQASLKELLEFPCDFPYKIMGEAHPELLDNVLEVIQRHAPGDYSPVVKPSRTGKYHSITVTINAKDIEQIEKLYKELGELERVRMVL